MKSDCRGIGDGQEDERPIGKRSSRGLGQECHRGRAISGRTCRGSIFLFHLDPSRPSEPLGPARRVAFGLPAHHHFALY
jgi:hypothetical protein